MDVSGLKKEERASAPASSVLEMLAARIEGPTVTLGEISNALDARALPMLLLVVILPTALPLVPGVHTAFAPPIAIIALQVLAGFREPWLPRFLRDYKIKTDTFRKVAHLLTPWLSRAEKIARPRFGFMKSPYADRFFAFILIVLSVVIGFPGTGTIGVPGMCAVLIALGMLERDGLMALIGAALGLAYEAAVFAGGLNLATYLLHRYFP